MALTFFLLHLKHFECSSLLRNEKDPCLAEGEGRILYSSVYENVFTFVSVSLHYEKQLLYSKQDT